MRFSSARMVKALVVIFFTLSVHTLYLHSMYYVCTDNKRFYSIVFVAAFVHTVYVSFLLYALSESI